MSLRGIALSMKALPVPPFTNNFTNEADLSSLFLYISGSKSVDVPSRFTLLTQTSNRLNSASMMWLQCISNGVSLSCTNPSKYIWGSFNSKIHVLSYQYWNSHCGDKAISWLWYLHNLNFPISIFLKDWEGKCHKLLGTLSSKRTFPQGLSIIKLVRQLDRHEKMSYTLSEETDIEIKQSVL